MVLNLFFFEITIKKKETSLQELLNEEEMMRMREKLKEEQLLYVMYKQYL